MDDHDCSHNQSYDVSEVRSTLENDGVGKSDRAGVTLGWDASLAGDV